MTDWPIKTLGDLMTVQNGYAFDSQFFSSDGKIGLIRIRDLKSGKDTETRYTGQYDDEYVVSSGDYLIGMDGEFRCYEWQGEPALLNQRVCRLRGFDKSLESRFLFYGINKYLKDIEDVTGYTTVKHLSSKSILAIEMPVPPLEEQKRIVALLDAATARITELTACYELASSHAKLLSGSMLVELLTSVEDSEPMRLGDVAELKGRIGWRGLTAKEYTKEGPLFVSVHSLNYGHFVDLKDAFHISQERYDESPEIMLKNNDIIICKDGAGIGKLGMVGQLPGQATINSSLLLIRASKKVRSEFLYFYLLSPIFQNLVQERLSGSTTPHLYQRDIAELVINLPSLETQDQLIKKMWGALGRQGDLVQCFDKQIGAMMRMRQSILESAFAGDL